MHTSFPTDVTGAAAIALRAENWSRHWKSGALHSCVGSFGGVYEGSIGTFWHEVFTAAAPGCRILDIATGNGALPQLLWRARRAGDWQCDAFDLAQVAPTWADHAAPGGAPRLRFHPGVQAEHLPFGNAAFDLVVSQYGLEYSNLSLSVPELLRVLAPGGKVSLVVHNSEGRPATLAKVERGHIEWLLSQDGLAGACAPLLEPLARAASAQGRAALASDLKANAAREEFNAAQDGLARRAKTADGADVLFETQARVNQVLHLAFSEGLVPARHALAVLVAELDDARWRLVDLQRHAMVPQAIDNLAHSLQHTLHAVVTAPVYESGHMMGWAIRAGY